MSKIWTRNIGRILIALCLSVWGPTTARAYDFIIQSQNFLHLGWGGQNSTNNKCDQIDNIIAEADVLVIQELMKADYPCVGGVPAGYKWESYGPYGKSYVEYYGFLYKSGTAHNGTTKIQSGGHYFKASNPADFIRPPVAIYLEVDPSPGSVPSKKYTIWIGNIHSIYGKTVGQRQKEAEQVRIFYNDLKNITNSGTSPPPGQTWPIIIAGDWNIPVTYKNGKTNPGFDWLEHNNNNADADPKDRATSLTAAGNPSSPYDHFIFSKSGLGRTLTVNFKKVFPSGGAPVTGKTWRQDVSDHLGIQAEVTLN
ncbi:hypothetical protein LPB41_14290 [Thalassospira sp. MA62]|nr:hypothetical protein [Thalassospira sp. MA62]